MLDQAVAVDLREVEQPDAVAQSLLLLPYLHTVRADDTALSNASLTLWSGTPGLTHLNLAGTQVTDAGIDSISSACRV